MVDKILNAFFNDRAIFKFSKNEQIKYMKRLKKPRDAIDRSFLQYKCQIKHLNLLKKIFLNLISFIGLIFYTSRRETHSIECRQQIDNLYLFVHDERNVPPKYRKSSFMMIEQMSGKLWTKNTETYYLSIKHRYRFHPFFLLKIYKKLEFYQFLICSYAPVNIITANEYSFTSSIMTEMCNQQGVKHINVMHGDKLFYFRDSFFYFNEMFVWDEFYIKLFKELNAIWDDLTIYFPKDRFVVGTKAREFKQKKFTYYLQMQTRKEMKILRNLFEKTRFGKIVIRPHPRYTDMVQCRRIFRSFDIENTNCVGIEQSLSETEIAVSVFSTVLLQADSSGIDYLIDDLSNKKEYEKLKDLNYRLIRGNVLSDFIKNHI